MKTIKTWTELLGHPEGCEVQGNFIVRRHLYGEPRIIHVCQSNREAKAVYDEWIGEWGPGGSQANKAKFEIQVFGDDLYSAYKGRVRITNYRIDHSTSIKWGFTRVTKFSSYERAKVIRDLLKSSPFNAGFTFYIRDYKEVDGV